MLRLRFLTFLFLALCFASGCATSPLAGKSPDERYRLINDNMDKLVTGGRISDIRWSEDGNSVSYKRGEHRYVFDLVHRSVNQVADDEPPQSGRRRGDRGGRPARGRQRDKVESPDGKWIAVCKDWNVIVEPKKSDDSKEHAAESKENGDVGREEDSSAADQPSPIQITTDGTRKFRYGTASWVYGEELDQLDAMWWSPDSTKLVFYEFDERNVPDHYITAGLTQLHTTVLTEGYPKPGEPNPIASLLIYDLATKQTVRVQPPEDETQEWYTYDVQFTPTTEKEKSELLFHRTNRHQNLMQLLAADPNTGARRIVLTETQETWQDNSPELKFLEDGHRFIWATEKSGWKQYELRDMDGALITPLTNGKYPVSGILRVDEKAEPNGVVYYTAFSDPSNPLNAHLHRVRLDGSDHVQLTHEPLNHSIASSAISPDGKWFIVEYQAIDVPPTTALYDTQDSGHRIATLAESDMTLFKKYGLPMPERFTFKADDGKTDLYGVLYKPSTLGRKGSGGKKFPLVMQVYGGPGFQTVRNRFTAAQAECEYGFVIAQVDNRGTPNRGKAFESATYLKLGEVDIKDQADGVRFLAKRPYIDGNRVGIMGHSYGGYMSALGVLKYPDVYYAGCAGGTVTNWKNYDSIYTERYMRTPEENADGYEAGSCMKYVSQLKGKLLLLHGMVDDNVHPNNAWQLIDALQKAGKPFEMMFYPESGHSIGARGNKIRWDFMRRSLLN